MNQTMADLKNYQSNPKLTVIVDGGSKIFILLRCQRFNIVWSISSLSKMWIGFEWTFESSQRKNNKRMGNLFVFNNRNFLLFALCDGQL